MCRLSGLSESDVFFFQAEDGIRDRDVTGVQTCALPIYGWLRGRLLLRCRPDHDPAVRDRERRRDFLFDCPRSLRHAQLCALRRGRIADRAGDVRVRVPAHDQLQPALPRPGQLPGGSVAERGVVALRRGERRAHIPAGHRDVLPLRFRGSLQLGAVLHRAAQLLSGGYGRDRGPREPRCVLAVRALSRGPVRPHARVVRLGDATAGPDGPHWRGEREQRRGRHRVPGGPRALGARQLRLRSVAAGVHRAPRAAVRDVEVPHGLSNDEDRVCRRLEHGQPSKSVAARPARPGRHLGTGLRDAARGFGKLLPDAARGGCAGVHAAVFEQCRRRVTHDTVSAAERDSHSVRAAVGRSGGRAVGVAVALLTAGPPVRLSAQTGGVAVLPGSARAAGLGGAGAAIVGDAGSIFTNPAGLATVHHLAVEGEYESYPSGVTLSTGALALRVGRFTWGAGAAALGPSYTSADLLGVSSLVLRTGLMALGPAARYARETVGGARVDAWAGDAGLAIAVFDLMALGVSVQNVGGDFGPAAGGLHLPRRTRAGFTLNYIDPQGTLRLLTTLEGQWPAAGGGSAFLVLGLESGVVARGMGVLGRIGCVGHSAATTASPVTAGACVEPGRLP